MRKYKFISLIFKYAVAKLFIKTRKCAIFKEKYSSRHYDFKLF